jgi:glycosyltransferase involved in cell wall biosynthesis
MKVKYCGPARDYSGYGEANRHDIAALVEAGIDVTTQIPSYCLELSDFGRLGEIAIQLENRELGYQIKILHTTPNVYKQFMEAGKYHIGRAFWETDKIPKDFADNLQLMDEIWTGSQSNAEAIKKAGVTKPIFVIPEAIDTAISPIDQYIVPNANDFKFYSLFEWTERKNPAALLEAYWREFENDQNVSLTIKTYVDNFTPDKKQEIKQNIKRIKKLLQLNTYSPLYIFNQLMDRNQIYRFHKTFDCFVSAHRGEGWGIPQMEAMLMGKPIISTNYGGIHEYLPDDIAFKVKYRMIPLVENSRNNQWYCNDQNWADIDIKDLRRHMRYVYTNRDKLPAIGEKAKKTIEQLFSLKAVGQLMRERLYKIEL